MVSSIYNFDLYIMRNFNRDGGSSRGGVGGRRGGGNRNGFSNRRNNGDRPEMFDAVCDNCGVDCRVPFRPSGDKPIYCSECFEELGNGREDRGFIKNNNFSSRNRDRSGSDRRASNSSPDLTQLKDQLGSISAKLDKILRLITPEIVEESEADVVVEPKKRTKKVKLES